MKRIVVIAIMFLLAAAVPALAQDLKSPVKPASNTAAVKSAGVFSQASIAKAVVGTSAAPVPRRTINKYIDPHKPWVYVIVGAAIVGLIALNHSSAAVLLPY